MTPLRTWRVRRLDLWFGSIYLLRLISPASTGSLDERTAPTVGTTATSRAAMRQARQFDRNAHKILLTERVILRFRKILLKGCAPESAPGSLTLRLELILNLKRSCEQPLSRNIICLNATDQPLAPMTWAKQGRNLDLADKRRIGEFKRLCGQRGERVTAQRTVTSRTVLDLDSHPSADQILMPSNRASRASPAPRSTAHSSISREWASSPGPANRTQRRPFF